MIAKFMTKFLGSIEELQRLVSELGFDGDWVELPHKQFQFTMSDGAILNWWPSTKTIGFQGPPTVKVPFEKQIIQSVANWKASPKASKSAPATISMPSKSADNKRVFVVHGHDRISRDQLELVLRRLGLDPFVLANTGGGGLTLIEALEKEIGPQPGQCRFGIVLLTPDDVGYAKAEGPDKTAPRARQNVVLEMGMVLSALRRPNVAILKKGHIEIPSDVHGIIYLSFNDHVNEAVPKLVERLNGAGFNLDASAVARATA
jgi:predicted nucleotide-binding protein